MKIQLLNTNDTSFEQATLLFGGDFCPRGHYEEKMLKDERVFSKNIQQELADKDFFIVNLETPLWNLDGPEGGLKCNPLIATKLKSMNINMAGFANNHALDRGEKGMKETLNLLEQNNILCAGAGANRQEANQLKVIEINNVRIGIWCIAEKELNIVSPNSYGTGYFLPEANIFEIERYRKQVDFLVVFVHAGHEFMLTPSPRIRDAYRQFIDAGANLIIGHHPHVVQGWECYKGKWIFYSLGNLIFDSPYVSNYSETDWGYLVRAKVGKEKITKLEVVPYQLKVPEYIVSEFTSAQFENKCKILENLSLNIIDDKRFFDCWDANVTNRWNEDYKQIISKVSAATANDSDTEMGMRFLRNILWCPTHQEIILRAIELNKLGKLD